MTPFSTDDVRGGVNYGVLAIAILKTLPQIITTAVTLPLSIPCMLISLQLGPERVPWITKIGFGLGGGWPFFDYWGVRKGGPVVMDGLMYSPDDPALERARSRLSGDRSEKAME